MTRDELGERVREEWIAHCRRIGDRKPSHLAPWDDLGEDDREADRRIGEALCRIGLSLAIEVAETEARNLPLPNPHGGAFAKLYARNALRSLAGILRNLNFQ